jgi:DNA-binding transcriptional LysR family regulator
MRAGHPAAATPFDLVALARWPHLDIRLAERPGEEDLERNVVTSNPARLDAVLNERGLARTVGATVGHFLAVAPLLARSDMIAFIPSGMARHFGESHGIVTVPPPYPAEPMQLSLLFHRTLGSHPAVVWLCAQLHELACGEAFETHPAAAPL